LANPMGEIEPKVAIVEDEVFLRKAGALALRKAGFAVVTAIDGEEALEMIPREKPDLVLLDLIMPKVQGFEVLRRLKADPATASIPVIVMSNLSQESEIRQVREDGAIDFLVKSNISLDLLVARVHRHFGAAMNTKGNEL
jgi:DNA-binding response OmpR family regulator